MNLQTLKIQLFGIFNLALPILIFYFISPSLFTTWWGISYICLLIGVYIYWIGHKGTKAQAASLKFEPTGIHKEQFEKTIAACKLNPQDFNLRYGFTNEMLAMTMFNTVTIDPLYVSEIQDPEMIKAKDILDQYIVPTLVDIRKNRIQKTKEQFSPVVQRFIFMHELAHVHFNYSYKKLIVNGFIGFCVGLIGINAALALAQFNGYLAFFVGILIAALTDIVLLYISNALFVAHAEKQADLFAAAHCSKEDLALVADFFEKHQIINDQSNTADGISKNIPSVFLNGHHNGFDRAKTLRERC